MTAGPFHLEGNVKRIQVLWLIALVVATAGCGKNKEAQNETVQDAVDPAVEASAIGTFTAQLPAADSPGRAFTLTLKPDNSAMLSVDFMNQQPAVVERGTWAVEPVSNGIQVKLQGGPAAESKTMNFAIMADTLALTNWMELGYGDAGLKLLRSPANAGESAP